jgi:hypothetical protein
MTYYSTEMRHRSLFNSFSFPSLFSSDKSPVEKVNKKKEFFGRKNLEVNFYNRWKLLLRMTAYCL